RRSMICGGGLSVTAGYGIQPAAHAIGYPVLAESYSHVRPSHQGYGAHHFHTDSAPRPAVLLRFGNMPKSIAMHDIIAASRPKALIRISPDGEWSDDNHSVTHFYPVQPAYIAGALEVMQRRETTISKQYNMLETAAWQVIEY